MVNDTRIEPRSMTLIDLIALVVGVAVAASLPWTTQIIAKSSPGWYVAGIYLIEALRRSCLVLVPVVFARRITYGGPVRPAEFLPMAFGIPRLVEVVRRWPIFGLTFGPGELFSSFNSTHRNWMLAQLALGILAAAIFTGRRGRSRNWLDGLLLLLVWPGLEEPVFSFYGVWSDHWVIWAGFISTSRLLLIHLVLVWPTMVIESIPLAAAVGNFLRRDRRPWTWVEWAGLIVTGSYLLLLAMIDLLERCLVQQGSLLAPFNAIRAGTIVVSLVGSFVLVRLFRPVWYWLMGGSPTDPPEIAEAETVQPHGSPD